jgi:hypothetical protein
VRRREEASFDVHLFVNHLVWVIDSDFGTLIIEEWASFLSVSLWRRGRSSGEGRIA